MPVTCCFCLKTCEPTWKPAAGSCCPDLWQPCLWVTEAHSPPYKPLNCAQTQGTSLCPGVGHACVSPCYNTDSTLHQQLLSGTRRFLPPPHAPTQPLQFLWIMGCHFHVSHDTDVIDCIYMSHQAQLLPLYPDGAFLTSGQRLSLNYPPLYCTPLSWHCPLSPDLFHRPLTLSSSILCPPTLSFTILSLNCPLAGSCPTVSW